MSRTIDIVSKHGKLQEADYSVGITAGGTVTFVADGGTAILCFAHETAAILSPSPAGPATLTSGESVTYTFGNAAPGGYPVIVVGSPDAIPAMIDFEPGAAATLEVSVEGGRGVDDDRGIGT